MLLTRRISWHMAHRIYGYDGLCGTLHGHTYSAEVSLNGPVDEKLGMICDFGDLKKIMVDVVDGFFDHSVFLWEGDPLVQAVWPHSSRLVVLSGAATAENLARVLFDMLNRRVQAVFNSQQSSSKNVLAADKSDLDRLSLSRIKLWETEKSSVEIDKADNKVQVVNLVVGSREVPLTSL